MGIFGKLFGKKAADHSAEEPIVIVAIPPLVDLLFHLEAQKGSNLTEQEVNEARDKAACMTMRASHAEQLAVRRGYSDISLENAWFEWTALKAKAESN